MTVPGAVIPNVYGGKQRIDRHQHGSEEAAVQGSLAPSDVLECALGQQNVVTQPGWNGEDWAGTSTTSTLTPRRLRWRGWPNLPDPKQVNGSTIYLTDIGSVADGSIPQTNIVRQDGHRGGACW